MKSGETAEAFRCATAEAFVVFFEMTGKQRTLFPKDL